MKKQKDEKEPQVEHASLPAWEDDDLEETSDEEAVIKKLTAKMDEQKKDTSTVIGSDDVLTELQVMFAFLQESLRQFYNPRGFCFANKVKCFYLKLAGPMANRRDPLAGLRR